MARVMVVAAYASVRAGLRALLAGEEGCEVVGEAGGADTLASGAAEAHPDVLLFDHAPQDAARVLGFAADNDLPIVMLGEAEDYRLLADLPLPGWALLHKDAGAAEIAGAVRAAASGLVALDQTAARIALGPAPAIPPRFVGDPTAEDVLTAREHEVLGLMAQGLPNKAIAGRLGISLHTAKTHVAAILEKLGAESRTEAVTLGARQGLVTL